VMKRIKSRSASGSSLDLCPYPPSPPAPVSSTDNPSSGSSSSTSRSNSHFSLYPASATGSREILKYIAPSLRYPIHCSLLTEFKPLAPPPHIYRGLCRTRLGQSLEPFWAWMWLVHRYNRLFDCTMYAILGISYADWLTLRNDATMAYLTCWCRSSHDQPR
jgi:hypothetical protein